MATRKQRKARECPLYLELTSAGGFEAHYFLVDLLQFANEGWTILVDPVFTSVGRTRVVEVSTGPTVTRFICQHFNPSTT